MNNNQNFISYIRKAVNHSVCVAILIGISISSFSQKKSVIETYNPNMKEVFIANKIIYYGIDFTKTVLTNPQKIGEDEFLKKYYWAWIAFLEEEIPPNKYISKKINKKDKFVYEAKDVQYLNSLNLNTWVKYDNFNYPIDTLFKVINSYKLKENKGVGFVVNVENLNKREEYVSAYFTFFDISTREIYWATKVKGTPDGWGMTKFWGIGILDATKNFINHVYQKELKAYKK